MANNCMYTMKVIGNREEDIDEFVNMLNYEYEGRRFARIFSADSYEKNYEEETHRWSVKIVGDCAWSVYSCMCSGIGTYYGDGTTSELTNLEIETHRLGLTVEIYSQEPGIGFAEHYIYDNGTCLVSDEEDYQEYWNDEFDTAQEFMEEYGLDLPEEKIKQLEEEGYVSIGGFDEVFTIS